MCRAGLNALRPRVLMRGGPTTSAVSEPGTPATATAGFAGFVDGAAFRANRSDGRRGGCWCLCVAAIVR